MASEFNDFNRLVLNGVLISSVTVRTLPQDAFELRLVEKMGRCRWAEPHSLQMSTDPPTGTISYASVEQLSWAESHSLSLPHHVPSDDLTSCSFSEAAVEIEDVPISPQTPTPNPLPY
jgi:hypothetical protein